MAEVSWIKITTTMFSDEKIRLIEATPKGDTILIIWIKLLALCGRCNDNGYVTMCNALRNVTPYTTEMLATVFNRPVEDVRLALQTFEDFGMIEQTDQGIYLTNWEKYQSVEKMERIREQTKVRVARHREKKKAETEETVTSNVTCNADVTPGNATDIDKDIDKELIVLTAAEQDFLETLQGVKNYPLDRAKDRELYQTLTDRYPELDILDVTRDWAVYKKDKPLDSKSNPRSQLNTACKKALEWGKNQKSKPRGDPPQLNYQHQRTDQTDLQKVIQRKTMIGLEDEP